MLPMRKLSILPLIAGLLVVQAGCADNPNRKQEIGAISGLLLGALAGSQIGDGKGRDAAIAAGAILGLLAGSEIGRQLDEADRIKHHRTMTKALQQNRPGQAAKWRSEASGASGSVTPKRDFTNESGNFCREFEQTLSHQGQQVEKTGTACRQADGSWILKS